MEMESGVVEATWRLYLLVGFEAFFQALLC